MAKQKDIRTIILKDGYDVDYVLNWRIVSYDANKLDILDIENAVESVKDKETYNLDDVLDVLYDLDGIETIEDLGLYEV